MPEGPSAGGPPLGGPQTRLLECTFLIPVVGNRDRKPHRDLHWRSLQNALRRAFGGCTGPENVFMYVNEALVSGEYTEAATGTVIPDESRKYTVAVPADRVDELRAILRKAANTFDQLAMYLSVQGEVEFVEGREQDGYLE